MLESMMRNNLVFSIITKTTAYKTNISNKQHMNGLFHCSIPLYWYRFTVVDGGIASCNISQHQVLNPVVKFMLKKEKMGPTKQLL
jgi:hypothetical protein